MTILKFIFRLSLVLFIFTGCKQRTETIQSQEEISETSDNEVSTEGNESVDFLSIRPDGVLNVSLGDRLDQFENLNKTIQQSGEGSFTVYEIYDPNGNNIGFARPSRSNPNEIGSIEITSSNFKTDKGIGVGSTFQDLKNAYPNSETHGSEIESRTTSSVGGLSFLLDAYFNTFSIDETLIDKNTKVKRVIINNYPTTASTTKNPEKLKYICYNSDDNNSKIWVGFNDSEKATRIKYLGQQESIELQHTKQDFLKGGAYPTIIDYYNEIYNGKVNGTYKLTKSGIWYYVTYTRGKDGKEFKYTIDQNLTPFSSKPCF